VEGQVSDDSTSNPAVWQIFIQVTADIAMKMVFLDWWINSETCGTAIAQLLQSWSSQIAGYRTPFAVKSPFCNTVSPGGGT
jgi:hypothetical protein